MPRNSHPLAKQRKRTWKMQEVSLERQFTLNASETDWSGATEFTILDEEGNDLVPWEFFSYQTAERIIEAHNRVVDQQSKTLRRLERALNLSRLSSESEVKIGL